MAPTETERLELREGLSDVLEEGPVTTLMDSLPPMDWHELATKTDLAALEERMDTKFERVDAKFDALRVEMDARFTEMDARFTEVAARFTEVDAKFEAVDAKFDAVEARITAVGGETKRDMAKQTYVILAGVAAIAAPFYVALFIALFTGGAG